MLDSIYVGLTGLASFSRNLTVIGNNVSNLNTTGFKSSQLSFSDLFYRSQSGAGGSQLQVGSGVDTGATRTLFKQGTLRSTGNATDLAIDGTGFFVLRSANKVTYTRAGEFSFDDAGFLVSTASRARVAALNGGGLQDLSIAGLRTSPAQPTTAVHLVDNLSSGSTTPQNLSVTVFDSAGGAHALKLTFTNNNDPVNRSWRVDVANEVNAPLLVAGEIRFNADGSPAAGFNSLAFNLTPSNAPASRITLDFGAPGGFSAVTQFSAGADSSIKVGSKDGFAAGSITQVTFDATGTMQVSYSNGQTARGPQVALAFFEAPEQLELVGGAVFENRSEQHVTLGAARTGVFGAINAGALESANVDLSGEFSDLIITQRGFQASSQVISTANDMMQQLFDIKGKR